MAKFDLGGCITYLRLRRGLSARELSDRCGLSPSYVSKVEKGISHPGFAVVSTLVRELGATDAEIIFLVRNATIED